MEPRVNLADIPFAGRAMKYLASASRVVITESTLPKATQDLVVLRASQINGCGFCTDMHTKDAAQAGETAQRLHLVAAWRETDVFTEAERAAFDLAEEGTRIADAAGGVPDEVWANAAKHYDEQQLTGLALLIGLINASNRMCVITRQQGGHYQPGQFD
ncbi:carboxymuconolactone decarboxylase family protein [Streptomyces cocklensis]|jgi:AhpD family alkylhydroperoxidase|uniref:AhpD family alkylhydroperoxidase n=1 Tax=Actinacidiphila cocklensis TaxID=887465 RepID=A0A9W4DR71_9ACTN|nr:carboxymuconolactone decarboxylase family protein [Actinacidiphila cocklensis]MDD1059010.1 carboxymuconolactone decarboxylase family protein [Actinacidiphila cocklensis]WSX73469.1 carboxymuconolactone decarboxylase family protein [Streptomyces sp. NBC_00899]WSX80466.1 carboxymuconolactone decarboxylase family protein [Streptomyces sp. NBC_00899]CAG6394514.1 AhpD family alkylhydroperoxidase [Actinacidiphila cocklensis]